MMMNKKQTTTRARNRTSEKGSMFVFLMIGIALFAALSYVVSQSLRITTDSSGSAMGTSERNTVNISDVMQFLDAVNMRVFQMTNANGVSENALDFKNDVYLLSSGSAITSNINPSCSTNACHVFSPYGTDGLIPIIFTAIANTTAQTNAVLPKNGHGQVRQIAIAGVGTSAPDLVFVIHGVRPDLCNVYNAKQGLTTTYTSATTLTSIGEGSSSSAPAAFTGAYNTSNNFGTGATSFAGKKSFCAPAYGDTESNRLAIWHVIKIR